MTSLRLAVLLWRRGGRRHRVEVLCTAVGIAAATALALLVLAVPPALDARGDRQAWQHGDGTGPDAATMVRRVTDESFQDRTITRVELAPTGRGDVDVPPGLDRFPAPGEAWLSPALAELVARTPADQLGDRWPAATGTIGRTGLAHDEELVVVVGRAPGELGEPPAHVDPWARDVDGTVTVGLASFARSGSDPTLDTYITLAWMAAVLLIVPTLGLIGAAARLTAAQRSQRLATLRLIGARPTTVVAVTALDTAVAALVGAVVGIAAYLALIPLATSIPLIGGPFSASDLRFSPGVLVGCLVAVPALAAVVAVTALRGVLAGPLDVRRQVTPRRPRLARFLVVPAAWWVFLMSAMTMRDGGESIGVLFGLAAVIGALSVIGPWVTWTLGWLLRIVSRRPATTIAARRTLADPTGAYRTVSGLVLAGLIAGFLFGVLPTLRGASVPDDEVHDLSIDAPAVDEGPLRDALDDIPDVQIVGQRVLQRWVADVRVHGDDLDRARTAVISTSPETIVHGDGGLAEISLLLDDLGRASIVMSVAALALAAASIGIGTATNLLDQRETLCRLRLIGVPLGTLQRARRWQVLVPLATASVGAMVVGVGAGITLLLAFGTETRHIEPPATSELAALAAAGLVVGAVVVAASRPLLERVSRFERR